MSIFSSSPAKPVVPVVDLKGVIKAGSSGGFGSSKNALNIDALRGKLTKAFNTSGAVAVVLDINSPGGSPAQSELIGNHIRKLAEEKNLPVIAFVQDVAASGGYWLACAADEIYSARTSVVGSIGVVNEGYGYGKLFEKLGLEARTFTAGESKRRMKPTAPITEEDRKWMESRLGKIHQIFKDWIIERRGDRMTAPAGVIHQGNEAVKKYWDENVFTGDIWYGNEAVEMGLIDGIGDMESVLQQKFGNVTVKLPTPARKSLLSLISPFGANAADAQDNIAGMNAEQVAGAIVEAAGEAMKDEAVWAPYTMR